MASYLLKPFARAGAFVVVLAAATSALGYAPGADAQQTIKCYMEQCSGTTSCVRVEIVCPKAPQPVENEPVQP
ncbi:MAG TPA: hypothetical protein VE913_00495 [Longimicrobium sp.]|nr:hypothetical protein [Longimicrobium sp.]